MARVEYVVCIYCGRTHIAAKRFKWVEVDPMGWKYLQVREGGGKRKPLPKEREKKGRGQGYGVGFRVIPEESRTIPEMYADPAYRPIVERMKARLMLILKGWLDEELITLDEIRAMVERPTTPSSHKGASRRKVK